MAGHKHVVIGIGGRFCFGARVIQGILNYWSERGRAWEIHIANDAAFSFEGGNGGRKWLSRLRAEIGKWHGDGVIAYFGSHSLARLVASLGLPVVNVSSCRPMSVPRLSHVTVDNPAVGRMAAGYFLNQGFREFAYLGTSDTIHSRQRLEGYTQTLREAGHRPAVHLAGRTDWLELEGIERWLLGLKRPVAITCAQDALAREAVSLCHRVGIRVPEEMAIVGVDNDPLICVPCPVSMSSVDTGAERVGYQAAAVLDRKMRRLAAPARTLVAPIRVVVRESSDVLAMDDPVVAAALRFIRTHDSQAIGVKSILREVPVSRRALEVRFKRKLGRTLRMEMCRVRMERVKQLLTDTDLTTSAVASTCGFGHPEALYAVFKRETGMTPAGYRTRFRVPRGLGALYVAEPSRISANH